ncbi:hypothetical protein [Trinickia dinghuensis]|uniref:hypothetical protein n=1 Tax=Trinickia dinghuensis TaxID=2291023 RepID=UPI001FE38A8C|nr:hypothetical protein [Trinickia dinghuensis]
MSKSALLVAGMMFVPAAHAAADADADALGLADTASATVTVPSNWRGSFELAAANYNAANQAGRVELNDTVRAASSLSYDGALFPGWRAVLSNRFDTGWRDANGKYNAVDTLKQAYISWQPTQSTIVDAGRINLREGVASGFNPTDFFKADAIRSIVSIDPASLRENRLGSVMLRGQLLWAGGSLSALVSPRLAASSSDGTFSPDFGATNRQWRYLISGTQRLFGRFSPQWLVYGGTDIPPQFGVNATALLDDATVFFVEYAGGRGKALADAPSAGNSFHSRLATGATRTFPGKVSATLEYDYDGLGANRATWNALAMDPARYGAYREAATQARELTTRNSVFSYVTWQDAFVLDLDVTLMGRYDLVDNSFFAWIEARYHWPRADFAVQWQADHGGSHSAFGAASQSNILQAIVTFYF